MIGFVINAFIGWMIGSRIGHLYVLWCEKKMISEVIFNRFTLELIVYIIIAFYSESIIKTINNLIYGG